MQISHGSGLYAIDVTLGGAAVLVSVSFAAPFVLLGLIAVPLLIGWYVSQQRGARGRPRRSSHPR